METRGRAGVSQTLHLLNAVFVITIRPLLILLCAASLTGFAQPAKTPPRKTAIFVENRAGAALNEKIAVLEDLITSRVTEKGFAIISREAAVNSLNSYTASEINSSAEKKTLVTVGADPNERSATTKAAVTETARVASIASPNQLDQIFSKSTSALRLAQNLGADLLLVASITSLGSEKRTFEDGAFKTVNQIHTLRLSYKILDAVDAGSLTADTVKVVKTVRFTENASSENSDLINEMLDEASALVAKSLDRKPLISAAPEKTGLVEITVSCGMSDLAQQPVSVPDIRVGPDGTLVISTNRLGILVLDATVEVNGAALGSAPGAFKVPPGLNKMRISRDGFNDWEKTVNFSAGQPFRVALQMSEAGYARWKDTTAFLFGLETGRKLTDATVKVMEGFAQTLRQSGYRVDQRTDIKGTIDAKGKSLFDGVSIQPSFFNK